MNTWIWQNKNWPKFTWNVDQISNSLAEVHTLKGELNGIINAIGFNSLSSIVLDNEVLEILKTSEIEGIVLNRDDVRSSVARRLGIEVKKINNNHYIDGIVNVLIDAVQNCNDTLNKEKLFLWHKTLFPMGVSDGYPIVVAKYRNSTEAMQVVSGAMGKEKIHYQAPPSEMLNTMMEEFFHWANNENTLNNAIKAAVIHLWFVSIHPFDDGNGRIARTLTDVFLARFDKMPHRFYSMSSEILKQRKMYYNVLEQTQKGDMDITLWIEWFLQCLKSSLISGKEMLLKVIEKTRFWEKNRENNFNERQIKIINMLFEDFFGVLNTSKWAKINNCSQDTALRDINDLINKGVLQKSSSSGRSTNYTLK